jgi:hypothetical protein
MTASPTPRHARKAPRFTIHRHVRRAIATGKHYGAEFSVGAAAIVAMEWTHASESIVRVIA